MRITRTISLLLVFILVVSLNVPIFAQQMDISNLDVQIIDRGEYVEIAENGSINRIYDYIVNNTRYLDIKDEFGVLLGTLEIDLISGQISRNGSSLNIKGNLHVKGNDILPQYLEGDGTEENPYKVCTPGATTNVVYHRYTAREIANVAGDASTAVAITTVLAALSGASTKALASISGAIANLAWLVQKSSHESLDRIGITFYTKEVCVLFREFDAGEYVYFYQNDTVCYNGSTFG